MYLLGTVLYSRFRLSISGIKRSRAEVSPPDQMNADLSATARALFYISRYFDISIRGVYNSVAKLISLHVNIPVLVCGVFDRW